MAEILCAYDHIVDINEMIEHPKNPNKHPKKQIEMLAKIIQYQGFRSPIVVSERSGFIVKGHGRLAAAKLLDMKTVPVDYQPYETEAAEYADMIADNQIAELAELDKTELSNLMTELSGFNFDLSLTGFDSKNIALLLDNAPKDTVEDEFDIEASVNFEPNSKFGDIYKLGEHILVCGNSIQPTPQEYDLLNGTLVLTDPPYNMDTEGGGILKTSNVMKAIKRNKIDKFSPEELSQYAETNVFFCNKPLIEDYITLAKFWKKPWDLAFYKKENITPNYGGHLMTDTEYIMIIGNQAPIPGQEKELYSKCYSGNKDRDNKIAWSKPIGLCAKFIRLYTHAGDKVIDMFGGSGSTLIACEQLKRKCVMFEINPVFVDMIIERFEKLTGIKTEKIKETK